MMRKITLGILATALMVISCTNNSPNQPSITQKDSTDIVLTDVAPSFYGTYTGTLPAADCEGIKTTLTLNDDTTYRLISEYLGKTDATFETNGVYHINNSNLVELITPSSGEKTFYKIKDNTVILTDSLGTIPQGELAHLYILNKQ